MQCKAGSVLTDGADHGPWPVTPVSLDQLVVVMNGRQGLTLRLLLSGLQEVRSVLLALTAAG